MISKKDLLKKMNISYGQLYRWKREELIPENWFMKLSVSSGQETFFEEELIIPRIKKILELKDKYSLEELKDILNGTSNLNLNSISSLDNFSFLNKKIIKENTKNLKDKEYLNINELSLLYLLSMLKDELNVDVNYNLLNFPFDKIKENNIITLIKNKNNYTLVISKENIYSSDEIINTYLFHELIDKVITLLNGGE